MRGPCSGKNLISNSNHYMDTGKGIRLNLQINMYFCVLQVCSQIEHGILALFGPSDLLLGTHVQSLCDALDIPHLEAR
jgi:hypothetical protein